MQTEEKHPSFRHIAHDLNNIFTRILNSIELLKLKIDKNDEALLILNNIESSTFLASEIIGESIENKNEREIFRRIKINSMIQDIVRSFQSAVKNRIEFEIILEPDLNFVEGRYSDFYRIILNLITNSVDAITGNGKIKLRTNNIVGEFKRVQFEITDNGIGIAEEFIPLVFKENYSTKSNKTISGVGLAIVKELVNKYNGTIELTSSKELGTTFKIQFPAIPLGESASSKKSILIAEDENILRELLSELLHSYGYEITCAQDGQEVLDYVKEKEFDLLIIDRKMPNLDGIECIERLRDQNFIKPIILASGSPLSANDKIPLHIVNKVMNKPYNFEEMLSVIKELIA